MIAFRRALLQLRMGDPAAAAATFAAIAQRHDRREAWTALAAACHALGRLEEALEAARHLLRRHAADPATGALLDTLARGAGAPGWCGVTGAGELLLGPAPLPAGVNVRLDGTRLRQPRSGGWKLPRGWEQAEQLDAELDGQMLLGSPLCIRSRQRIEGFVAADPEGGLAGWAWHPADPDADPVLTVSPAEGSGEFSLAADDSGLEVPGDAPLARPRRFHVSADRLTRFAGPWRVCGPDGRDLPGSPLDPGAERRDAAAIARGIAALHPVRGRPRTTPLPPNAAVCAGIAGGAPHRGRKAPVDVVVPVYRDASATMACLASVLATLPRGSRLHVVDDASPEPELTAGLRDLAAAGRIRLIRRAANGGFPAAANDGLRAAAGRDVVLLNSDTLVFPGWIERLRAAAHSAPDIGTVTPFSNDATILSYPKRAENPVPDVEQGRRLAELAAAANGDAVAEIPTGIGFCLYIRADCLAQTGLLREDVFAQGYGEENDFCLRARHLGWRHVAATGTYVAHVGGASFGPARRELIRRNLAILNRLHPGYDALIAEFEAADPLAEARRRFDIARWSSERGGRDAVILITHAHGGGVKRLVGMRCAALREQGLRPVVLHPAEGGCLVGEEDETAWPNLRYRLPDELPALAALLKGDRPRWIELHHLAGHEHALTRLAGLLGVPYDAYVHDYFWFCPRIALVGTERRYCGEPDIAACESCVADGGSALEEEIGVRDLVQRSAADLRAARRVVVPSVDAATRILRHFPGVPVQVTPWENDAALTPPLPLLRRLVPRRVCIPGAIGTEKGYEVVLACARDAARRDLPLEFVIVGHTVDDARMLDTGRAFVTGEYAEEEAVAFLRAQDADLAFIPSIWPETWSFTLTLAWRAGLRVAAFDLGTPAERIRRTGWGWLLPLAISPAGINNALLAFGPLAEPGVPSHHPSPAAPQRRVPA